MDYVDLVRELLYIFIEEIAFYVDSLLETVKENNPELLSEIESASIKCASYGLYSCVFSSYSILFKNKDWNKEHKFRMYIIENTYNDDGSLYILERTETLGQAITSDTNRMQILKTINYASNNDQYIEEIDQERLNRVPNRMVRFGSNDYAYNQTYKDDYSQIEELRSSTNFLDQQIFEYGYAFSQKRPMSFCYDPNGNITEVNSLVYDANGNITSEEIINQYKYYYDKGNRLIREDNLELNKTCTFEYDEGGNITSKKEYAYTTAPSPSNPTSIKVYTYDSVYKDQLMSYDNKDNTYDSYGNPTMH